MHEGISQGKGVKGRKEQKESIRMVYCKDEGKLNIAVGEDTEEVQKNGEVQARAKWTCAGKNLAGRMEEEVLEKYKVEESKRGFQK